MTSAWIQHVKNYQSQHPGMTYKQAMTEAKSTYNKRDGTQGAGFKDVVRKTRNTAKRARKTAKRISHEIDRNEHLIQSVAGDKALQTVKKVQGLHDQFEEQIGGRIHMNKVLRKTRNTVKKAKKVAKKATSVARQFAPVLDVVAPEIGIPLHAGLEIAERYGGELGSEAGRAKYRKGGSFRVPSRSGGALPATNSSMINPLHPSFNPLKPKPVSRRQKEN